MLKYLKYVVVILLSLSACNKEDTTQLKTPESNNTTDPSNPIPSNPTPNPTNNTSKFKHKILVEGFTSTNCGYCPGLYKKVNLAKKADDPNNQIVLCKIYRPVGGGKFINIASNKIRISYKYKGSKPKGDFSVPSYFVNRVREFGKNTNKESLSKLFLSEIEQSSPIGIKISSEVKLDKAKVNIDFEVSTSSEKLTYTVYILENGCEDGHDHVLIGLGANNKSLTVQNNKTSVQETIKYSSYTKNIDNLDVVVYVIDSKGKVIQTQIAKANTTKNFEII